MDAFGICYKILIFVMIKPVLYGRLVLFPLLHALLLARKESCRIIKNMRFQSR